MSGLGMGSPGAGTGGDPGRSVSQAQRVLPGGGPWPHPCVWQLLAQLSGPLNGEGEGPDPRELGLLPGCTRGRRGAYLLPCNPGLSSSINPPRAPLPVCWGTSSPGNPSLCPPEVWVPDPCSPSQDSRPCPAPQAPCASPGLQPPPDGETALSWALLPLPPPFPHAAPPSRPAPSLLPAQLSQAGAPGHLG